MDAPRLTHAEQTTAMLQRAARDGLPVLIPGAFEVRSGAAAAPRTAASPTAPDAAPAIHDRARLEREREGGGAPSQRTGIRRRRWRLLAR